MRGIRRLYAAAVIGSAVGAAASAAGPATPVVYEDDYILVGAGVAEAGLAPIHIGDALTLRIEVEFDPRIVQIETLDGTYFDRALSATPGARLSESGGAPIATEIDGRLRLSASRRFQFLDCPRDMSRCPGSKRYELPVMTIAYRVADPGGGSASNRSARFRPWPGIVTVAASIPFDFGNDIGESVPGGAYPEPQPVAAREAVGPVMLLAGGLLLASGWLASVRRRPSSAVAMSRTVRLSRRWQRALAALDDAGLSDEEWSDLLRRSVVWYCLDELQRNPYDWLSAEGEQVVDADTGELRQFFLELLHEVGIEQSRRDDFLARFAILSNHPLAAEHRTA